MARGIKPQIGAVKPSVEDYLQTSRAKLITSFTILSSFQHRLPMFAKFGLNTYEVWALLALHGFLTLQNKVLISHNTLINYLSGTHRSRQKFCGYYKGLLDKKFIGAFEYTNNVDSFSVGISDLGFTVINSYFDELDNLFARYVTEIQEKKQEVKPYKIIEVDVKSISTEENWPNKYKRRACA